MTNPSSMIHVYCDESCHLENDSSKAMVLGAIWCQANQRKMIGEKIKALKSLHGISANNEVKWTKVSPSKLDFYLSLVDIFFETQELHFRGYIIPDKSILKHDDFAQSHDDFYYKMWYHTLIHIINERNKYRIFIDIKDTNGTARTKKLHDVLSNSKLDFDRSIIVSVEQIQSHDVPIMQMVDIITGALSYFHRGLSDSSAKVRIIERIRQLSGRDLLKSSLPKEEKLNYLIWQPRSRH